MPVKPHPRKASDPEPIAAYKTVLRDAIDRRPAGLRARIALALGKHKSFVSQLTNPIYPMPIPARHIETIFEICHFTPEERRAFLRAYGKAHPDLHPGATEGRAAPVRRKTLALEIPLVADPDRQAALERLFRELADRLGQLLE